MAVRKRRVTKKPIKPKSPSKPSIQSQLDALTKLIEAGAHLRANRQQIEVSLDGNQPAGMVATANRIHGIPQDAGEFSFKAVLRDAEPVAMTVQEQLGQLEKQISNLTGSVYLLHARIQPVLAGPVPVDPKSPAEPPTPDNIAMRVSDATSSVIKAAALVDSMIARLQV